MNVVYLKVTCAECESRFAPTLGSYMSVIHHLNDTECRVEYYCIECATDIGLVELTEAYEHFTGEEVTE